VILTAFCDLQFCPVSYDFITFLERARLERDRRKCDGLHVVLVPLDGGLAGFSRHWGKHDAASTTWRLWHIVVASCPLAGATVTVAPSRSHAERMKDGEFWWPEKKAHFMGPLVDASRKGESIPMLRATDAAKRYVAKWLGKRKVVTVTLRSQNTDSERNSDRESWIAFTDWLEQERGQQVIVIEDSNVALGMGEGYATLDPDLRLALYEQAVMNVIGNNGPQELLEFSEAPYIIVGLALTDGWKDHWRRYFHMEPGEQLPWARKDQRMVYQPDTFEVLKKEFENWVMATRSS
jgi:hypothetical protein